MSRILTIVAAGACAGTLAILAGPAQAAPDLSLARFECGTPQAPVADLKLQFVYSCYLIKHAMNTFSGTPATR